MRRPQAGAGLIEVAVALLLLTVGTLGLARGLLAARQAASEALQRGEAVRLAGGLLEVVQVSPGDPVAYQFGSLAELTLPDVDCGSRGCNAGQWARWNLWRWRGDLEGSAARDGQGSGVAGLIAPAACLSIDQGAASLELAWRRTPLDSIPGCGGLGEVERNLVLVARPQVIDP